MSTHAHTQGCATSAVVLFRSARCTLCCTRVLALARAPARGISRLWTLTLSTAPRDPQTTTIKSAATTPNLSHSRASINIDR